MDIAALSLLVRISNRTASVVVKIYVREVDTCAMLLTIYLLLYTFAINCVRQYIVTLITRGAISLTNQHTNHPARLCALSHHALITIFMYQYSKL